MAIGIRSFVAKCGETSWWLWEEVEYLLERMSRTVDPIR